GRHAARLGGRHVHRRTPAPHIPPPRRGAARRTARRAGPGRPRLLPRRRLPPRLRGHLAPPPRDPLQRALPRPPPPARRPRTRLRRPPHPRRGARPRRATPPAGTRRPHPLDGRALADLHRQLSLRL